ncbi:MAG: hypothetical protein GX467_11035, partial [Rikenellaceae bacterium]|nr:hypothetical protein [Rikenellaceae bacterium]
MRLNLLLVLLLLNYTLSYSQSIVIDSLKHELKKAEKAKKIPLLNQLARLSLSTSLDEAEDYARQALSLSDSENKDKALAYHNLGLVYYFRGIPDSAIKFY